MKLKTQILDEKAIYRCLVRISHEIIEKNKGCKGIILLGIKSRGYPLAKRISKKIAEFENHEPLVYPLDISSYRDDLEKGKRSKKLIQDFDKKNLENKNIILVDDVLYTGRTVRSALDALVDLGRPQSVQLAALIDRGHRELPIRADYVGKNVPTSKKEIVKVELKETDGSDSVKIFESIW